MLERLRSSRPHALAMDPESRQRRAGDLLQRLLLDVARLGYGDSCTLDYMPEPVAHTVRSLYDRYLRAGWHVESDFGDAASGSLQLDDDAATPVRLDVVVEDRSVLRRSDGTRQQLTCANWRMRLILDGACTRVVGLALEHA